jgi:cell division protease FtsH
MEGTIKVAYGPQRRSAAVSEEDKVNTAYHESGHAIVSRTSKNLKQVVNEISIIPRGMAGGYTAPSTEKEMFMYTKEQLMDEIEVAMGGRAAEYIIYGKYSTGPSNDLEKATNIAREMITKYGMSDKLGPVCYSNGGEVFLGRDFTTRSNISEKTAELIDQEIKDMLERSFQNAIKIINKHRPEMEVMVKVLLEKETIYSQEVDMILDGKSYEEVIEFINKRQKDHEKEDSEAKKAKEEPKDKAKEEEEKIEKIRKTALDAFYNTNQDEPVEEPKEQEKNKKEEKKQEKKSEEGVKTESDDDNKQGEN